MTSEATRKVLSWLDGASRLFRKEGRRGVDKEVLRVIGETGQVQHAIERELLEALAQFVERVERSGAPPLTPAEVRQEVEELLQRWTEVRKHGEVAQLRGTRGRVVSEEGAISREAAQAADESSRAGNVLGKAPGDLERMQGAIEAARDSAIADIRGSEILTAAEKDAQIAVVRERYRMRLDQVLADSATARKLYEHWDAAMTPERLKSIFGPVSQRFAEEQERIAGAMKQLEGLRAKVVATQAEQAAIQQEISRLTDEIRKGKAPITAALRDAFKRNRQQILKSIFEDEELVQALDRIDLVLKQTERGTVQIRVRVPVTKGAPASFLLNVDHAGVGFEEAVDAWLRSGNAAHLESILRGDNLQFVEGIENQVALVALRKPGFVAPPPRAPGVRAPGLKQFGRTINPIAPKADVDAALAGLGRSLSAEEQRTIQWVKAQFDSFDAW